MDRLVADLTVAELYGLLALALCIFYLCGLIIRTAPPDAIPARIFYWIGLACLVGLPVYFGLRVFFPSLPAV